MPVGGQDYVMRDYYEVLGVPFDATTDQIRKAYKVAALRCHPDRNHGRETEAADEFKEVQQAHAVLMDDKERQWYDAHKESILRGDADGTSAPDEINLYQFFNVKCYSGFNDGNPKSFFSVFRRVYDTLKEEEQRDLAQQYATAKTTPTFKAPPFGDSKSSYEETVAPFYQFWSSFSTKKSFAWKDEYKVHEMPDRRNRRAAEQHNMKERAKARREFSSVVQELTAHIRRLDPRVEAEEERVAELEADKQAERRLRQAEQIKRRREADRKLMEEAAEEEARQEEEEAARLAALGGEAGAEQYDMGVDEQFEKYRQEEEERLTREKEEEETRKAEVNTCEVCGGATFKGAAAWSAHQNSKKHKNNLRTAKRSGPSPTASTGEEQQASEVSSSASPTSGTTPSPSPSSVVMNASKKKNRKGKGKANGTGSDGGDDEDALLQAKARLGKGKRKGKSNVLATPQRESSSSGSESDESSEEGEPAPRAKAAFGGFAALAGKKKR